MNILLRYLIVGVNKGTCSSTSVLKNMLRSNIWRHRLHTSKGVLFGENYITSPKMTSLIFDFFSQEVGIF